MRSFEKFCIGLRHSPALRKAAWLWNGVRPLYNQLVRLSAPAGLERIINGTDRVLVLPELRGISESYEPEVWTRVMAELRPGDTFIDVGAFHGLYAVAVTKRLAAQGRVVAFEPVQASFDVLQKHISLNDVTQKVEAICAAVGDRDGTVNFATEGSSQSSICVEPRGGKTVPMRTLDSVLHERRADIIKIDVEGFEELVLRGAKLLLNDPARKPRAIFIEVHPYNWHLCGTTSDSLLGQLRCCGYKVTTMDHKPVSTIDWYGEIVALPS
jgi:FkbM family methyltransferase